MAKSQKIRTNNCTKKQKQIEIVSKPNTNLRDSSNKSHVCTMFFLLRLTDHPASSSDWKTFFCRSCTEHGEVGFCPAKPVLFPQFLCRDNCRNKHFHIICFCLFKDRKPTKQKVQGQSQTEIVFLKTTFPRFFVNNTYNNEIQTWITNIRPLIQQGTRYNNTIYWLHL